MSLVEQTILEVVENFDVSQATENDVIAFGKTLFSLWDTFIADKITSNIDCKVGCANCCNHWVEDLYFFEAIIIKAAFNTFDAKRQKKIIDIAHKSIVTFEDIYKSNSELSDFELLHLFYKEKIPCPFLSNGSCLIYEVRPLTCRGFFSRSNDTFCDPNSNTKEVGTFTIHPSDNILLKLDTYHELYKFKYPTALRALFCDRQ